MLGPLQLSEVFSPPAMASITVYASSSTRKGQPYSLRSSLADLDEVSLCRLLQEPVSRDVEAKGAPPVPSPHRISELEQRIVSLLTTSDHGKQQQLAANATASPQSGRRYLTRGVRPLLLLSLSAKRERPTASTLSSSSSRQHPAPSILPRPTIQLRERTQHSTASRCPMASSSAASTTTRFITSPAPTSFERSRSAFWRLEGLW